MKPIKVTFCYKEATAVKKVFFLTLLFVISIIHFACAEDLPIFCDTSNTKIVKQYSEDELFELFEIEDFEAEFRYDYEAIEYYYTTEEHCVIYDDGHDVIMSSDSGFFFGKIQEDGTVILDSLLYTDYGIWYSSHGYMSCSVYKTGNGYCISGKFDNGGCALLFIDIVNDECRYFPLNPLKGDHRFSYYTSSFDDRYMVCISMGLYSKDYFIVIDKETCAVYKINMIGIDHFAYFDENGIATFIINDEYGYSDVDYENDFYKYNEYYYYCVEDAKIYPIKQDGYEHILYADANSIIVEEEFCFAKIENGEKVWQIDKKEIFSNSAKIMQNSKFFLYGTAGKYHTFSIEEEKKIGQIKLDMDIPAHMLGWSGRYSLCYFQYYYDEDNYYDNLTGAIYDMDTYNNSCCIYNQGHIIWYDNLVSDMGGSYGVFYTDDGTYLQRKVKIREE